MTREEAISCIKQIRFRGYLRGANPFYEQDTEAMDMAIQALSQEPTDTWSIKDVADTFKKHGLIREQEPCDDAISRDAAINIASLHCLTIDETVKALEQLPSVTQKSGKWIKQTLSVKPFGEDTVLCNQCAFMTDKDSMYNYCPNCGCLMVEPQEGSDKA